MFHKRNQ